MPWNIGKSKKPKIEERCVMNKEVIKVSNAQGLANARQCMMEAIKNGDRPIVIEFIDGYDGSDVDGAIRHERNPYEGCPEQFK